MPTMPITEGNLWELGVMLPIINPSMERFEQFFTLGEDIFASDSATSFMLEGRLTNKVKNQAIIRLGPSSDKTRDSDGDYLYYGKYETFFINYYTSSYAGDTIYIKKQYDDDPNFIQNNYLKGDPITIRCIAESWNYLKSGDFSDITSPADPTKDGQFIFSRHDSIDNFKGYSQLIYAPDNTTEYHMGIIQSIDDSRRTLLSRLIGTKVRASYWFRTAVEKINISSLDNIDEGGASTDNIEEMPGGPTPYSVIDERNTSDIPAIIPYIRFAVYDDINATNKIMDIKESWDDMEEGSVAIFSSAVDTIPEQALMGKLAVYAKFTPDPRRINLKFMIDDVVVEHCKGTSKESKGFYCLDMNPDINISVENKTTGKIESTLLGIGKRVSMEDPNLRFNLKVSWKNRPGYFINDLKALESWNKEGYPIVLRTFMPAELPFTLFCNMSVDAPSYLPGDSVQKSDVSVEFEEVTL